MQAEMHTFSTFISFLRPGSWGKTTQKELRPITGPELETKQYWGRAAGDFCYSFIASLGRKEAELKSS